MRPGRLTDEENKARMGLQREPDPAKAYWYYWNSVKYCWCLLHPGMVEWAKTQGMKVKYDILGGSG